jgi:hypothetical protein
MTFSAHTPHHPPTTICTTNNTTPNKSSQLQNKSHLASSLLIRTARTAKEDAMHTLTIRLLVATVPLILLMSIITLSETIKKHHGKRTIKKAAAGALRGLAQGHI